MAVVKRVLLIAALSALAAAGPGAAEAMAKKGVTVKVSESDDYGKVLMSKGGKALYLFTKDGKGPSDCYGDCAVAWPPLLTKGKPVAGKGAIGRKLGTTMRTDGKRQVTYGGHPVYFYEHDRPGVILCQDVFEFGGTWLLVKASGKAVR
jgi:predicted lipoprotein with Yx(FWY)xxD motif